MAKPPHAPDPELPLRLRWSLAIGASIIADAGLDATALGGWPAVHVARARGEDALYLAAVDALRDAYAVTSRETLMAWARERLHTRRELAHVVAAFSIATLAQYVSEDDAWQAILVAAKLAQLTYRSWDDFAATCEPVADEVRLQWAELPWATELDVVLLDPSAGAGSTVRVLRSTCPACGARCSRPSPTAFVYCDHCGQLADYDFERACERPLERPGPAYEAICRELAGALAAADGDVVRARAIQRALFDAWVDACPGAVSIRIQDPAYRAAYVAMLAEGETRAALDREARELRAAMDAAVAALDFATAGGRTRVHPERYRAMEAAMFAHEARRHELAVAHGIYELHPDRASPELIRRIAFATYAQGWLPYLDEADAEALLARTGLARAYDVAEPPATRAVRCPRCATEVAVVVGAKRIICATCGRLADAAPLSP